MDFQEGSAADLREGEVGIPVAAVVQVIENAADAARFLAMRQIEISSHHFLYLSYGDTIRACASQAVFIACMERQRVRVVLGSPPVEHRRQVGAAAEPALVVTTSGCSCARPGRAGFRMCAISEMPDAQNRGSSAAPGICARNSGANSPCTVEHARRPFRTAVRASSTSRRRRRASGVVGAVPGRSHEAAGIAGIERRRGVVFQPLEGRADVVAQRFEPGPRARLAIVDQGYPCSIPKFSVVIASEAKQSIVPRKKNWIASSLCSSQ